MFAKPFALFAPFVLALAACATGVPPKPAAAAIPEEPPPTGSSIGDMSPVVKAAKYFEQKYGKDAVLVVYDIDNTLLASSTLLGSDQWYVWQRALADGDPQRVWTGSSACLLDAQELLYNTRPMRITHDSALAAISELRREGFTQWVLTSRGREVSSVTFRELRRQSLAFSPFSPALEFAPEEFEYTQGKIDEFFTAEEQKDRRLNARVRLESGVYLTAGMHKGSALFLLLDRLGLKDRIHAVVFADDTPGHVEGMNLVLKQRNIDTRA